MTIKTWADGTEKPGKPAEAAAAQERASQLTNDLNQAQQAAAELLAF